MICLSGLPRSGGTLLYNLLQQNYRFSVMSKDGQWGTDKSLNTLFQIRNPKIILTYRPILEVLASFIQLANQYPESNFIDKGMAEDSFQALSYRPLDDARCDWLMRPNGGIELRFSAFKNSVIHNEMFHVVSYDELTNNPKNTLKNIYDFVGYSYYDHDLNNIIQKTKIDDANIFGIPTLHTIRKKLDKSLTNPQEVLSDYVIQKYSNAMDFYTKDWLQSQP